MLILMLISAFNTKDKNKNILKLTIFGVFLFYLLWETRSRYLINYIPIMVLLTTEGLEKINFGLKWLYENIKLIIGKCNLLAKNNR